MLWKSPKRPGIWTYGDGLLAGLGLRFANEFLLADIESELLTNRDEEYLTKSELSQYYGPPDYLDFTGPTRINVSEGAGPNLHGLVLVHRITLRSNIALYRLKLEAGQYKPGMRDDELPVLQSNGSVQEDCYLYAYSFARNLTEAGDVRKISRWPVSVVSCPDEHHCLFKYDVFKNRLDTGKRFEAGGEVCRTFSDVGAPIVCGTNPPKLSFMIAYTLLKEYFFEPPRACLRIFPALKLAPFYKLLAKRRPVAG